MSLATIKAKSFEAKEMLEIRFLKLVKWKNVCGDSRQKQFLINIWEMGVTPALPQQETLRLYHLQMVIMLHFHLEDDLMIFVNERV